MSDLAGKKIIVTGAAGGIGLATSKLAASYVNGQAFPVDGGLSASHPWVYPQGKG